MELDKQLKAYGLRVEHALDRWLPAADILPARLHEAMRYAVLDGGKRIRPALVYAAGQALAAPDELLDAPAAAVELVHAYSLVHDDLPAMDDDDLRRGKPTCHKAYGEAFAILAGDALQALAFQVLAKHTAGIRAEQRLEMLEELARAGGSRGMAGGQAIDLSAVGRDLTLPELETMHIHKTGALIRASVRLGALCSPEPKPELLKRLEHYANCVGLAFQIHDDVLDVEADTSVLGKTQGADLARDKPTYPALLGLQGAKERAQELRDEALDSVAPLGDGADVLRALARYIVERTH